MKLRSFLYTLAAGATVLLLIAVGGFFWLTSQSPLNWLQGGVLAKPTSAIFVPKQTPVMVSLLVNPDSLEGFRQLVARPINRRKSRIELNQLENSLLANIDVGLDYHTDIEPWLGDEITLAVTSLDFDRNRENAAQPGYLLALTTKDPERAREFLQLFYSEKALAGTTDLVFEQYKGVNLIYRRPRNQLEVSASATAAQLQTPETLTSAVVGDRFVLFANHPKVLRNAINNVQAVNLNLENDPVYQQTLQSLREPRVGIGFVNLPALAAWIANQPMPVQDTLQGSETVALALSLNRQGLLAQTASVGTQSSDESRKAALAEPVDALQYIPAKSALAIAGADLHQFWNQLSTGFGSDKTLKPLLEQSLASLQSSWGISLPEDIFSWVQGEYALSLLPGANINYPDWIFVAQKTGGATTEAAIEHLDTVAKQQGLSVGDLSLKEQQITAWTKLTTAATTVADRKQRTKITAPVMRLEAQVQGVHAAVGNYEIFTSSVGAMDQALQGRSNSLLKSDEFQNAIAPLPQQNDGYLYLDWSKSKTFLKRQLPIVRVAQLLAKPLLGHLHSLSISSYGIDQGVHRSQLFIRLENGKKA